MQSVRGSKILVAVLLVIQSGLLAWGATRHSPSIDEVGHLAAGLSHWQLGQFDLYRVNPPLVRMIATLPVLGTDVKTDWRTFSDDYKRGRLEHPIGRDLIAANGSRSFWYFTIARWACIPLSLLGGYICFRWARELYGCLAGCLALALWCFCPNILGNGQMITPDTGAAALGVAACYLFRQWLKEPGWSGAFTAGLVLGFAELTKTTWLVLFALWPVLWALSRCGKQWRLAWQPWLPEARQLGCILALGLFILNLGYGFEDSLERLGNFPFASKALTTPEYPSQAGTSGQNRFKQRWLGALPVPVPRNYLLGIDTVKAEFEETRPSYLGGEWRQGGWWYFYLYGSAIKIPVGTWVLVLLALFFGLSRGYFAPWRDEIVLLGPVAVVLILVSSQAGFQHLRYILPIFPFAFIWVSKVAQAAVSGSWTISALASGALVWSVASSLWVYPHSLSYFNELAGGPKGGHAYLLDSNIDWGQDVLYLKRWLDEHPEAHPLGLAYFGWFDPRVAGIEFTPPPMGATHTGEALDAPAVEAGPQPGWYAVSVMIVHGYKFPVADGQGGLVHLDKPCYTYFQRFKPVAMAGYSIYIYHISLEEANQVRRQLGLDQLDDPGASR